MRNFSITIRKGMDYEITLPNFDYSNSKWHSFKNAAVGEQRSNDEKIGYIFSATLPDDEELEQEKEFMEVCQFLLTTEDGKYEAFKGSFVDAFRHIKKYF